MGRTDRPPKWIKPQLTRLVNEAPSGDGWLHEIKYDGYRMHARIDSRDIKLLTRTGLDWSFRYHRTTEALGSLKVKSAYIDRELCALNHSPQHPLQCNVCAEYCRLCAASCREIGDMDDCVAACEACADSCERMAASSGGHSMKQSTQGEQRPAH